MPGTEIRRTTTRGAGADGQPVETQSYTVTLESPGGRYEVAGQPRGEVERFWAPVMRAQRAALEALPRASSRPGPLELRERWRYVTVSPAVAALEEGGFHTKTRNGHGCRPCAEAAYQRGALFLSSFGASGVAVPTAPAGALDAGMELQGNAIVFGDARDAETIRVERPSAGRLTVQRDARCSGRIVRVDDTLVIHNGSGVIAVPHREDHTWHELRDASCVERGDPMHEVFGPSAPVPADTAKNPARFRIEEHRAELARLQRGELKGHP